MKHSIEHVWQEIETIKNNHLEHIKQDIDHIKDNLERVERIVDKQDSKLDKMDARLWWVFTLVVGTVFLGAAAVIAKMLGVEL
jgi:hypothetical protein